MLKEFLEVYKILGLWLIALLLIGLGFVRIQVLASQQAVFVCESAIDTREHILELVENSPPPPIPEGSDDSLIEVLENARQSDALIKESLLNSIAELRKECYND